MHSSTDSRFAISLVCLGNPKPTVSDENATYFLLARTVVVILVSGDQLVQPWVGGLVGNAAGDPFLDPLQYHIVIILPCHGGTIYPQENVVVWCSPGLVLFIEEVVGNSTQCFSIQNHSSEEVVKFLRKFPQH